MGLYAIGEYGISCPTITTSLSGYGVWCEEQGCTTIDKGVAVIYRNDSNTHEVITHIVNTIEYYLSLSPKKVASAPRLPWSWR